MMTTEQGGGESGDERFLPSPQAWNNAFERQLTDELMESLHRYAKGRARLVARYRKIDADYALDLLHDVVADTLEGKVVWNPTRVDLRKHLHDVIWSRARHDYLHAKHFRTIDVSTASADAELTEKAVERQYVGQRARQGLDEFRRLAAGDREVLLLLDAYEDRVFKKDDVLDATGLTSPQYHAARARLRRLRARLSDDLQPVH